MDSLERCNDLLKKLYGAADGGKAFARLKAKLETFSSKTLKNLERMDQRDALLITYPDQFNVPGEPPLKTLVDFCMAHLDGVISGLHVLPFFPYSSDDGFSIIDYRQVDPQLGDWSDIRRLSSHFRLMVDGVINHISAQGAWYQAFLAGDPTYQNYFIVVGEDTDLSMVVRPRSSPLLTEFVTAGGAKRIWTTFSADQVDLNYQNPDVLLAIIDVILFYIEHGASLLRLDAIAYVWKEIGTSCINLPQTHRVVKLLRAVLDVVAPYAKIITETNIPHHENLSYFGNGSDEAQLVYNFALPPLLLYTFQAANAKVLSDWVNSLALPDGPVTFLNFLASHDGIGLNPVRGLLASEDIDALVLKSISHGGLVSYKDNPDGTLSPYELNINYFDALSDPCGDDPLDVQVDRFMAAQAILLALKGVPGIYVHSMFGSRGWREGVNQTGRNRTINRQKSPKFEIEQELADPSSLRTRVFNRYAELIRSRAACPAFDPYGGQLALDAGQAVFSLLRTAPAGGGRAWCAVNVSGQSQVVAPPKSQGLWEDTLGRRVVKPDDPVRMEGYRVIWCIEKLPEDQING